MHLFRSNRVFCRGKNLAGCTGSVGRVLSLLVQDFNCILSFSKTHFPVA